MFLVSLLIFTRIIITPRPQHLSLPKENPRDRHHRQTHECKHAAGPMHTHRLVHLDREQRKRGPEAVAQDTVGCYC
jgi:hypothetical protein